ncbi:MAG: hypothetical protein R2729_24470 [Bryobacteraceae bacterium]
MPTAFSTVGGRPRAVTGIRRDSHGAAQSLEAAIPDGDTVGVHIEGSGSVRFLGIDTPEKAFDIEGQGRPALDSPKWDAYLTNPLDPALGLFQLESGLAAHLAARFAPGAGRNHHAHGIRAQQTLSGLVNGDIAAMGQAPADFRFYLAFAFEVFDAYGRFLAFINRNQPDPNTPGPRPLSYNERMLEAGAAMAYFIWPNIDPFRSQSILDAVIAPGRARETADASPALRRARELVKQARAAGIGIFDTADPLRFEAFEVRYLGRREPPSRAVIDLSSDSDVLLRPQSYHKIPNSEDRLFIPSAFVPLFAAKGWKLEGWF